MRKLYLLLLLSYPLSAPRAASQSALPPTSTIETIAGGEHTGIPGPEFGISSVSGLVADSDGNVYFSIEAKSQVFRLGVDGKVTVFAGSGVREKHVDGALPLNHHCSIREASQSIMPIMCTSFAITLSSE